MSLPTKVKKLFEVLFFEVRYWFGKNWKKLLVVSLSFVALSLVAITQGIGYEAKADVTSTELLVRDHPCLGYFVTGNLSCSFNPFLYPVTHIFGYATNSTFTGLSEPYDSRGKSVKDTAEISVAFRELPKNVPYYVALSLAVAFGSSKLIKRVRHVSRSSSPTRS